MIKSKSYATKDTLRSYLFFWSGQFFSILGSSIVNFAIIWWVTLETQSAVYLSIAAFFSALPFLISTPIAGVVADRWDRRHIIIVTDSSQAIITFLLILMFISGYMSIWVIIFTNALRAVFQAFHSPSVNGIIPVMI
ncbi:MAG: MFS transporter, partial [Promethearchaeota archaeon]